MLSPPHVDLPADIKEYKIPYHLTIALTQIGTTEILGKESNSKIDEYLKSVNIPGNDEIPWCAAFANWVLLEANLPGTGLPNARSFLDYRRGGSMDTKIAKPELGCLVIFSRGSQSWQGHVGFYLDYYRGLIRILGGNQKNRVGINAYSTKKLLGYRKVEYEV